jgi:uncharacterized membrane protein
MDEWLLLAVCAGLLFGVTNGLAKIYAAKAPAHVATTALAGVVLVLGIAYLAFQKDPAADVSSAVPVLAFIAAAGLVWFAATLMQLQSFGNPKALLAVAGTILVTATAISCALIGALFFGDRLSAQQAIGLVLAIAGTVLLSL